MKCLFTILCCLVTLQIVAKSSIIDNPIIDENLVYEEKDGLVAVEQTIFINNHIPILENGM